MTAPRWVHYFSDPLPAGLEAKSALGGKGASLKEMTGAGLAVPPGFTIITEACAQYYASGRKWPEGLEDEVRANLARLEKETGRGYGRGARPLLVSVRSGAAASMPGMMDTLLNCGLHPGLAAEFGDAPWFWERYLQFVLSFARTVHGLKEEAFAEEKVATPRERAESGLTRYAKLTGQSFPLEPWELLRQCINAVFESWESERAQAYRWRNDIRGLKGTAVNVQQMFPSEVSGVCFTQDPTNLGAERMVIESSYGLGESVVSGEVSPDRFLVSRGDFGKIESHLGQKATQVAAFGEQRGRDAAAASLTAGQVGELCGLALRIEKHFDAPMDLEWGLADGRFALLQCRPIRGLEVLREVEPARRAEIERLKALAGNQRRVWVTHNLAETLRSPTPLTWDLVSSFMTGAGGFGRLYRQLGYRPGRRVSEEGFLELICGKVYADPDRLAGLFWEGMPLTYDLEALAEDKSLLDRAPEKFDAARADGFFLARLPANLWAMLRSSRRMKRARETAQRDYEERALPPFLAYVREKRAQDLRALSEAEVLAELEGRRRRVLDEFGPESLKPGFFAGLALATLEAQLVQLMGEAEGREFARTLTLAPEGDVTFEKDALLHRVARGRADLKSFMDRFGHRCADEMELATPRWRENPHDLDKMLEQLRSAGGADPEGIHRCNLERRQKAEAELPSRLAHWGGSSLRENLEGDVVLARRLLPYRETGKFHLMMGYELLRLAIEELARRWELGRDVYFLRYEELPRFSREKSELAGRIPERRRRWEAFQRLELPDVVDSKHLDSLGIPQPLPAAKELSGAALAPGTATGPARIVRDPRQPGELGAGYILVCASTDPGWTPLFMHARGLVVERGGVLSHGAIVARDFGIPAVACPNATRLLPPGATVRVDGNQGRVSILEGEPVHAG